MSEKKLVSLNSSARDFIIFPWQRSFLSDLKYFINQDTDGRPGTALIIVPHKRPWRYFEQLYQEDGRASALPAMLAFSDLVALWNSTLGYNSSQLANSLDITAILLEIIKSGDIPDSELKKCFSEMPLEKFLPWGLRLGNLLEEIQKQGVSAQDISYAENEVVPAAAALLGALGKINNAYLEKMRELGWTTPGIESLLAFQHAKSIPPRVMPKANRPVYIAGFYALDGVQEKLFRCLWEAGAKICLHTDPAVISGKNMHQHVIEHSRWLKRWHARAKLADFISDVEYPEPENTFWAGYDVHSQIEMMAKLVEKEKPAEESVAIVCSQPDSLMPVLHHLPEKAVNISMGYPLTRSPLINFVNSLLAAVETRDQAGNYYWKDLRALLRQPYLKMLDSSDTPYSECLARLEKKIALGSKFVNFRMLLNECATESGFDVPALLHEAFSICLFNFETVANTAEMAAALEQLRVLLLERGVTIWERFPLDAEALNVLAGSIIPVLRHNILNRENLSFSTLRNLLNRLLEECRVPFEADPLTGLQILGLLETRLLHFDKIYILDATEDVLPGQSGHDPLLPDSLRALIGLPDSHSRQAMIAHNLTRLCAGASEVRYFWQEGISKSTLFDDKKSRSRFVEELIWKEEQKRNSLLEKGKAPLYVAETSMKILPYAQAQIEKSEILQRKVLEFLTRPVSATKLDMYLRCPLAFLQEVFLKLAPPQEVNEGDDPPLAGELIHRVLQNLLSPYLDKSINRKEFTREKVQEVFQAVMRDLHIAERLPLDSLLILELAGPKKILDYLEKMPEPEKVCHLEYEVRDKMDMFNIKVRFYGKIDRIDLREDKCVILDYKIGHVPEINQKIWQDEEFFTKIKPYCNGEMGFDETSQELFQDLRANLPSIQLPLYYYLFNHQNPEQAGNAAYVGLRDYKKEISLFASSEVKDARQNLEKCHLVIAFIIAHLINSPFFEGIGDKCGWCAYKDLCRL